MGHVGAVNGTFHPPSFVKSSRRGLSLRLKVSGEVDHAVAGQLNDAIRSALEDRPDMLTIDLSETTFIDSSGIYALLTAHRLAESRGISLVVVPAPAAVQRIFRITGVEATIPFAHARAVRATDDPLAATVTDMPASPAPDVDQSASEADQGAADRDQTAADQDQTSSESNQASSDADQRASDRDDAIADRQMAAGDASADERADLETSHVERGAATADRRATSEVREATALNRSATAAKRDETANDRDWAAQERDRAADHRDRIAAQHDRGPAIAARAQAGLDRARAAADRERAADDRKQAAVDRDHARAALARDSIDGLTGIYRREIGAAVLQREIDRAHRGGRSLVLAYVDVDNLRNINDEEGHAAGDALLVEVVTAICSNLRSYDPVVRFGGDDFVCALADSDLDEARTRFDDIQSTLQRARKGASVSVGFAVLEPGDDLEQLVHRSDSALHQAKREQ